MSQNNPLPYIGAIMIYSAANTGEKINGQQLQPFFVTSLINDRMVNGVSLPDGGGACVSRVNVPIAPHNDSGLVKAGSCCWPQPRFT